MKRWAERGLERIESNTIRLVPAETVLCVYMI